MSTGTSTSAIPGADQDGLTARPVRGLDAVLVRPGVDFRVYKTVLLDPLEVAFDRNWDPNRDEPDISRRLSPADIEKIKAGMASEFRSVFIEELTTGGYRIVEQAGADTLRIKPALADVYINAPEKMAAGMSRSYTMEAGEMTLRLDAHDGPTGQLLARVVDKKAGPGAAGTRAYELRNQSGRLPPRREGMGEAAARGVAYRQFQDWLRLPSSLSLE